MPRYPQGLTYDEIINKESVPLPSASQLPSLRTCMQSVMSSTIIYFMGCFPFYKMLSI